MHFSGFPQLVCYGKNAHSVGGEDCCEEMSIGPIIIGRWYDCWSNNYAVLEATEFALISTLVKLRKIRDTGKLHSSLVKPQPVSITSLSRFQRSFLHFMTLSCFRFPLCHNHLASLFLFGITDPKLIKFQQHNTLLTSTTAQRNDPAPCTPLAL